MERITIKRVDISSVALLFGIGYALLGAVIGLMAMSAATLNLSEEQSSLFASLALGIGGGIISMIGAAIVYGIVGLIVGAISAVILNFILERYKGIELDIVKAK